MTEGSVPKFSASHRRFAYRSYLPTALIFITGLGLSLGLFSVLRNWERSETETVFQSAMAEIVSSVEKEIETEIRILELMSDLFQTEAYLSQQELNQFIDPFESSAQGIETLGWIAPVRDSQRAEYEASLQQLGFEDFHILEQGPGGTMVRAAQRDEYFPQLFRRSYQTGEIVRGFDVASDPIRAEALTRARDTGELSISAWVPLIGASKDPFGFLGFVPFYKKDLPADSVKDRRRNLTGLVVGVFRIVKLVEHALSALQPIGLDLLFYGESAPEGERNFYFHPSRTRIEPIDEPMIDDPGSLHQLTTFEVGDHRWAILATATPSFMESHATFGPWYGLLVGLLFTGLLVTYVATSTHRAALAVNLNEDLNQEIVERKRAEEALEKSERNYSAMLNSSIEPVFLMDKNGVFLAANEGMAKRFNTSVKDLIGTCAYDLLPPDVAQHRARIKSEVFSTGKPVRFEDERDGRHYDNQFYPVFDEEDHVVSLAVYSLDITKNKQAEEALRKIQENLLVAEEVANLGSFERDFRTGEG